MNARESRNLFMCTSSENIFLTFFAYIICFVKVAKSFLTNVSLLEHVVLHYVTDNLCEPSSSDEISVLELCNRWEAVLLIEIRTVFVVFVLVSLLCKGPKHL